MTDFRKHASSLIMETSNESESEDDSISSASSKPFALEMPLENHEGESELQEDSSKVNTENSEMAPKPKRQREEQGGEFDMNADQETVETEFSVKKKSCVKKGGPRSLDNRNAGRFSRYNC